MVKRSIRLAITDTYTNPIVLFPLLAQIVLSTILFAIVLLAMGVLQTNVFFGEATLDGLVATLMVQDVAWLIIGVIVLLFLTAVLFIAAFFDAGYYVMLYEGIKKKAQFEQFLIGAKKHFKSFAVFFLLKYLTIFLFVSLIVVLWLLIPMLVLLWLALFLFGILFFTLAFLFAPMHLVRYNTSGFEAYTSAITFFLGNKSLVLVASVIAGIVIVAFSTIIILLQTLTATITVVGSFVDFVAFVLNLFIAIFIGFFLFRVFLEKTKK